MKNTEWFDAWQEQPFAWLKNGDDTGLTVRQKVLIVMANCFDTEKEWLLVDIWDEGVGIELQGCKLSKTENALRCHLDYWVRKGMLRKTSRPVTNSDSGHTRNRSHYSVMAGTTLPEWCVLPEEETTEPTPTEDPAASDEHEENLEAFFLRVRKTLLDNNIVSFTMKEDGSVSYEERIVIQKTLVL